VIVGVRISLVARFITVKEEIMDLGVAERLLNNLKHAPIEHDQLTWLRNGDFIFVISEDSRWDCATRGCAAGFIYLEEAPEGSVFDASKERVYSPEEWSDLKVAISDLDSSEDYYEVESLKEAHGKDYYEVESLKEAHGKKINLWAGEVLGVSSSVADGLFFNLGGTEEIIEEVEALVERARQESA
jgi:hypothetical protein